VPGRPIVFHVERIRDGRSFTTRRVVGMQYGEAVFNMTASFQKDEEDPTDYQLMPPPDGLHPDEAPGLQPRDENHARWLLQSPFEVRELGPTDPGDDGVYQSTRRVWFRARSPVPDDPLLQVCALTYATDMGAVSAALVPVVGAKWLRASGDLMVASLDHAVWFHRPVRVDEWLYFDLHAVSNQGSRGLVRGTIHHESGTLVASMTQEALVRKLRPLALGPELG
jgi:acyl-CoA thioesterase-2